MNDSIIWFLAIVLSKNMLYCHQLSSFDEIFLFFSYYSNSNHHLFSFFLELPNNYLLISIEPSGEVCQTIVFIWCHIYSYTYLSSVFFFSSFLLLIYKDNYFSSICTSFNIWHRCCCCCCYSHRTERDDSRRNKKEKKNILIKDFYWKSK